MSLTVSRYLNTKSIKVFSVLKTSANAHTLFIADKENFTEAKKVLRKSLRPWQIANLSHKPGEYFFDAQGGPLVIIIIENKAINSTINHYGLLTKNNYGNARDGIGRSIAKWGLDKIKNLNCYGLNLSNDTWSGIIVGLEMGQYNYKNLKKPFLTHFYHSKEIKSNDLAKIIDSKSLLAQGVNLARHLVNTPPNLKRPIDYASSIKSNFEKKTSCQVFIWDEKKLKKEKMGMMLAVGAASAQAPRLVHLCYRPKNALNKKPYAFVGKGITFDTGGLNLKPGGSMRLMKKDMGGSASLVGLAHWLVNTKRPLNCDFYFALAENAVDAHAFRPGDIIQSRKGIQVEIDNTDAEGRLVLGDALCLASESKPEFIIDLATLTGAIKVGLGADTAGLFSNNDQLADQLLTASSKANEPAWRMPLLENQRQKLNSNVADMANSTNGFGGAIRAAMFLQEFIGKTNWAHFDIYGWNDRANGAFQDSGGNGQQVQALSYFLDSKIEQLGPN